MQHRNSLEHEEDARRHREEQELELRRQHHAVLNPPPRSVGPTDQSCTVETTSLTDDPFQSTIFSGGFMYDASGEPVLLSAGPRETEQERLCREIDNITAFDLLYGTDISGAHTHADANESPLVDEDATQTNVAGVYDDACAYRVLQRA